MLPRPMVGGNPLHILSGFGRSGQYDVSQGSWHKSEPGILHLEGAVRARVEIPED
ncbi:hypothetical protein A2U01_0084555 [Trifolium medium]|uniref:Uncharacterized protein n=1 Tax=Trifolium medium TaxID=97028 RepID=A0A392TQV5_9FABA|nr:hypothetical protein [Trifolium medium]